MTDAISRVRAADLPTAADDAKLSLAEHIDRLRFNLVMGLDAHPIGRSITWLLDDYDRLRALADTASHAPIEVAEGWQSIESAPKDGDAFLAYGNTEFGGERWEVVFWYPTSDDNPGVSRGDGTVIPASEWCWGTIDGPTLHRDCFTHWRKLETPSTGEREPPMKEG